MLYKYCFKIQFVNTDNNEVEDAFGVLFAENSVKAMEQISTYFGEDELVDINFLVEDEYPILFADHTAYEQYVNREYPFLES